MVGYGHEKSLPSCLADAQGRLWDLWLVERALSLPSADGPPGKGVLVCGQELKNGCSHYSISR